MQHYITATTQLKIYKRHLKLCISSLYKKSVESTTSSDSIDLTGVRQGVRPLYPGSAIEPSDCYIYHEDVGFYTMIVLKANIG